MTDKDSDSIECHSFKKNMRKATLLLCVTLLMLIVMNISPALPIIEKAFINHENVHLFVMIVFTVPSLALGLFSPLCGKIVDRFGRKNTLIISLIVYAASGTAPAFLNSLEGIITTRFILGISTATISTAVMTLITDYYVGREREEMMAMKSVFIGLGGLVFLVIGGWLAQISWRAPFYLDLFPLLLVIPAWIYLDEPKIRRREAKNTLAKNLPWKPLIQVFFIAFLIKSFIYIVPMKVPFLLEEVLGTEPGTNGMLLAFSTVASTAAAFFFPAARKFLSHHIIFTLSFFSLSISFLVFAFSGSYFGMLSALAFSGIAFGWVVPNSSLVVAELTPVCCRGLMMGILTSSLFLGQFITPFLVHPVESRSGLTGYTGVFGSFGLLLMIIALFYLFKDITKKTTYLNG